MKLLLKKKSPIKKKILNKEDRLALRREKDLEARLSRANKNVGRTWVWRTNIWKSLRNMVQNGSTKAFTIVDGVPVNIIIKYRRIQNK